MKKLLIVVDYQNDFVSGSLGFKEAPLLEPYIIQLINEFKNRGDEVVYTMDTHPDNYLEILEGNYLPVEHCIEETPGWELYGGVKEALSDSLCFKKQTFPSLDLAEYLKDKEYESITLIGLVSHICVISNAIMAKAALPNTPINIDLAGTSSFDLDVHNKSLDVLRSLQINLINE